MKRLAMSVVVMAALACGNGTAVIEDDGFDELEVAEGPLLGADGKDASDRSCNVVLRSLARIPKGPAFTTKCTATTWVSGAKSFTGSTAIFWNRCLLALRLPSVPMNMV